jgi:hypothetical protein
MLSSMDDQPPSDPLRPSYTGVLDAADASDPAAVREVFRAQHRLAVSVIERPQEYRINYSLGDIHRLTFLSHDERTAVRDDWHAWHRKYMRLSALGGAAWILAAVMAGFCWFRASALAEVAQQAAGVSVSHTWIYALGGILTVGLLMSLAGFLAMCSAPALCESYLRGYADGLTRGVNRALRISPDVERTMWDELRDAERSDADWRRAAVPPDPAAPSI